MPNPQNTHWLTASWCFRDHPKEDTPPPASFWGLGSRETMLELLHKGRGKSWYWFRKRASARLKGWMISPRLGRILEFPGMETCPWLVCSRCVFVCVWERERERVASQGVCACTKDPPLPLLLPIQLVGCDAVPFPWYPKSRGTVASRLKNKGPSPNLSPKCWNFTDLERGEGGTSERD